MNKYVTIGAGWEEDRRISVKLDNGVYLTLWPNDRKTQKNQPDYKVSIKEEDIPRLGDKPDKPWQKAIPEPDDDLDLDDLPF